jgi:hypothetical protein
MIDPPQPDPCAWAEIERQAKQVWVPIIADEWLRSANSFLDGARPIDVAAYGRYDEVQAAITQVLTGAFA